MDGTFPTVKVLSLCGHRNRPQITSWAQRPLLFKAGGRCIEHGKKMSFYQENGLSLVFWVTLLSGTESWLVKEEGSESRGDQVQGNCGPLRDHSGSREALPGLGRPRGALRVYGPLQAHPGAQEPPQGASASVGLRGVVRGASPAPGSPLHPLSQCSFTSCPLPLT